MRTDISRKLADFRPIIEAIDAAGFAWSWTGNWDTLAVLPRIPQAVATSRFFLFWIANQGQRWFFGLPDGVGRLVACYQIETREQARGLISSVLSVQQDQPPPVVLEPHLISQHNLIPVSYSDYQSEQSTALLTGWKMWGWQPLNDMERRGIWDLVPEVFPYHTSGEYPRHSTTWDVARFYDDAGQLESVLEPEFTDKVLLAMREHTNCNDFLYVLVADSWAFRFTPHSPVPGAYRDYWAVPPLPGSDMCYLLSHDFRFGIISDWRGKICIFGQGFLETVKRLSPAILDTPLSSRD